MGKVEARDREGYNVRFKLRSVISLERAFHVSLETT